MSLEYTHSYIGTLTLDVNKSLLTGSDIRMPSTLNIFLKDKNIRGKMIFDNEEFDITLTSLKNQLFVGNTKYLLRMYPDFRRKARKIFAYTYTLFPFHKKLEFNETITFHLERIEGVVVFREVSRVSYQGEALTFMQMMVERNTLAELKESESSAIDEDEEEKEIKFRAGKPLNLLLKRLDHILPQTSKLYPIEDLDKHHLVSNCIYIWYAEKSREVYIGSAVMLHDRVGTHINKRKKEDCHLTHFAYMEFHHGVPMPLVRMIERILIKCSSLLLPNLSEGIHARNPLNRDIKCTLLNKAYH